MRALFNTFHATPTLRDLSFSLSFSKSVVIRCILIIRMYEINYISVMVTKLQKLLL